MALDREFFDSINIGATEKKYYDADKVNALLEDIRTQALALQEENERLRAQVRLLSAEQPETEERIRSAEAKARQIIAQARRRAEEITREAESRGRSSADEAAQQHALQCVEKCLFALRQRELDTLDLINSSWQEFLIGLMPEEDDPSEPDSGLPKREEMESWISTIAREMDEINKK